MLIILITVHHFIVSGTGYPNNNTGSGRDWDSNQKVVKQWFDFLFGNASCVFVRHLLLHFPL